MGLDARSRLVLVCATLQLGLVTAQMIDPPAPPPQAIDIQPTGQAGVVRVGTFASMRAALQDSTNRVIRLGAGLYACETTLNIARDVTLIGETPGIVFLDGMDTDYQTDQPHSDPSCNSCSTGRPIMTIGFGNVELIGLTFQFGCNVEPTGAGGSLLGVG